MYFTFSKINSVNYVTFIRELFNLIIMLKINLHLLIMKISITKQNKTINKVWIQFGNKIAHLLCLCFFNRFWSSICIIASTYSVVWRKMMQKNESASFQLIEVSISMIESQLWCGIHGIIEIHNKAYVKVHNFYSFCIIFGW